MEIERVGVVGAGLMGSGIAEVAARAGCDVVVREVDEAAVEAGRQRVRRSLDRAVERERLSATERDRALERLRFTTELEALADRDLVVEAIVEDAELKAELFRALDGLCAPGAVLATNTSSIPVTELAAATDRPERVLGLHFFNPVPVMRLVEVVRTLATADAVAASAFEFARRLGKVPIAAPDRSGFVVNLLLVPFMLDAIRQLERGLASIEDVDRGMMLGCGHPMGPFQLCDFVGNDTTLRIAEIMFEEYREGRYAPPPLLKRMVALGRFGRKSGRGFYDYSGDEPVPL
ncbi:MAG: 3-hydroxybutyryl-CoA dehydrogenase, partial [Longimicrobiales bacterium]|nr:3-hydroxybutyryl-CoA dehydrogenase [Longimicrobiales bacterium]